MTPEEIQKIEKAGYTHQQIVSTINMIFMLADVQEQFLLDYIRMLKAGGMHSFDLKYNVERAISEARKLVKFVDKNCSMSFAERFGDKSDELKTLLDEWAINN